jgi:Uma2 family endonuclease
VEEYLRLEERGRERHEYINGVVHAMSGASEPHNVISLNLAAAFHAHLRGGPCRAYIADFKVRLEINREDIFYYPDVMVACERAGVEKYYLRYPTLVVEVLSPSTKTIDRREKLLNYPQIETVEEYVLVSQNEYGVTIHRRSEKWAPTCLDSPEAIADFRSINLRLPLSRIYECALSAEDAAA